MKEVMKEIIISQAGNGLILNGTDIQVFEMSSGKKAQAVRKLLEAVGRNLGQGLQVEVKVVDPAGDSEPDSSIPELNWLTPKLVSKMYGVPESTLQDWRSKGIGPSYSKPSGSYVVYSKESLNAWYHRYKVVTNQD